MDTVTEQKQRRRQMGNIPPIAITYEHLRILDEVRKKMNVPYYAQAMRWAIDALEENPNVQDDTTGPFERRLPMTSVYIDQIAWVNQTASIIGISRSQVVRNAIRALEIKFLK